MRFLPGTTIVALCTWGATVCSAQSVDFTSSRPPTGVAETPVEVSPSGGVVRSMPPQAFSLQLPSSSASTPLSVPPVPRQLTRKKAIILGAAIGGAVGATAGFLIAHDSCDSCNDSAPTALVTAAAGLAGAALGGFVGAQNAATEPSRLSLRPTSTALLSVPHPVLHFHVGHFR